MLASMANGTSIRFGADSLPYLEARAEMIVLTSGAVAPLQPDGRFALYQVGVETTLRGELPDSGNLTVALHLGTDVPRPEDLKSALLFLRQDQKLSTPAKWRVVSGRYGVVPAAEANVAELIDAISRFSTEGQENPLAWSLANLESAYEFLQRSAVHLLMEPRVDLPLDDIQSVYFDALISRKTTLEVKKLGLTGLTATADPTTLQWLSSVARNISAPIDSRLITIETLPRVSGGIEILWELEASRVPDAAGRLTTEVLSEREALWGPRIGDLESRLRDGLLEPEEQTELVDAIAGALTRSSAAALGRVLAEHSSTESLQRLSLGHLEKYPKVLRSETLNDLDLSQLSEALRSKLEMMKLKAENLEMESQ